MTNATRPAPTNPSTGLAMDRLLLRLPLPATT